MREIAFDAVTEQLLEVRQLLLSGFVDVVPVVGDAGVAPAYLVLGVLHDVAPAVVLEEVSGDGGSL